MTFDDLHKRGEDIRAKLFHPALVMLDKAGVKPNYITLFRAIGGPVFVVLLPSYPKTAAVLLLIAALLDLFDGALARYQGSQSDRGKFWDIVVDNMNYLFAVYGFIRLGIFSETILSYHLMIVPLLYLLATIVHSENRATDWIIHPYYRIVFFKPFAVLAGCLYIFLGINWLNETILLLNIAMTAFVFRYVVTLSRRWAKEQH